MKTEQEEPVFDEAAVYSAAMDAAVRLHRGMGEHGPIADVYDAAGVLATEIKFLSVARDKCAIRDIGVTIAALGLLVATRLAK